MGRSGCSWSESTALTVPDEHWEGPVSERAKAHAGRVAATLARRILNVEWTPPLDRDVKPQATKKEGSMDQVNDVRPDSARRLAGLDCAPS